MVVGVQESVPHGGGGSSLEAGVERPSSVASPRGCGVDVPVRQRMDGLRPDVTDAGGNIPGQPVLDDKVPRLDVTPGQQTAPGAAVLYGGREIDAPRTEMRCGEYRNAHFQRPEWDIRSGAHKALCDGGRVGTTKGAGERQRIVGNAVSAANPGRVSKPVSETDA